MEERQRFISRVLESQESFSAICESFGISRKTGYKWIQRFQAGGYSGLHDHSRRPNSSPAQLSETLVCELIKLKLAHPTWGPKKIRELYSRLDKQPMPSLSSVDRIFRKAGLVKTRKVRSKYSGRITTNLQIREPNDVWTVDFKGWWRTYNQERFEPLTVRDAYSRYLLAACALPDTTAESVKQVFIKLFREYGLPKVIHSDNGPPFASRSNVLGLSQLSAWLLSLGVSIDYSRPGHPQDNGGHERMHKDLKEGVQVRYRGDAKLYQAELDSWRKEFNHVRPHESLDMKTPTQFYHPSARKYKPGVHPAEYPSHYQVRKVNQTGNIKIGGNYYFITSALRSYLLGLKTIGSTELAVYFGSVMLGIINLETISFLPAK